MWIKRHHYRGATVAPGRGEGAANHGLVAGVHAIENSNCQEERTRNRAEPINRVQHAGDRVGFTAHGSSQAPRMRETAGRLRMRCSMVGASSVWISSTLTERSRVNLPLLVRRSDLRCAPQPSSLPMSKA